MEERYRSGARDVAGRLATSSKAHRRRAGGRGDDLVMTCLQEKSAVAKEVGENVIEDCVAATLKLASMVSGEIIALMFSTLPWRRRTALLRGYPILSIVGRRGVACGPYWAPFDALSASSRCGLRRRALWCAQAHGGNFSLQLGHFPLHFSDSHAVLWRKRRGTFSLSTISQADNLYLRRVSAGLLQRPLRRTQGERLQATVAAVTARQPLNERRIAALC